jgi:hypothetical protein
MANESRVTGQVIEVLAKSTATARATSQVIEVLAKSTATARATSQVVEILAAAPAWLIMVDHSMPGLPPQDRWRAVTYRN